MHKSSVALKVDVDTYAGTRDGVPRQVTAMEPGKAESQFEEIPGRRAKTTAAPGWTVSPDSLEIQDTMELCYCGDSGEGR